MFKFVIASVLLSYVLADTEMAPYEVLKAHEGWEERSMPALKWISGDGFDIRPHDGESAQRIFWKLFSYIDGGNDQGVKIPMTTPVSYRVIPGEGPNCEGNFTMSFFIPMAFQENTPLPLDSDVYIEERPAMNVAAIQFPGFPGDVDFGIKGAELYELAANEGVNVADVPLWTASYDGPNIIINSYVLADTEMAPYEVLKAHEGWEERSMPALKWISGDGFDIRPHDGESHQRIFWKLFSYIDGGNDQGVKIPMTSPVSYRVIPGEGPNCEGNFTMSFFIPMAFQENTPLPLDSDVYIEERPAMNVAAIQFPGFPGDIEFGIKGAELYELAANEGVNVADVPLWTAGYDGPNIIINRRNEVWLEM